MANNIDKVADVAGNMLVNNIRLEANERFKKGNGKYPYDYHDSFQQDDVVFYKPEEKKVLVRHPAAFRLEYGMGPIDIKAKGSYMKFTGQQGENVYAKEVHVGASRPVGYARAAIKRTAKELKQKFKDIIYAG